MMFFARAPHLFAQDCDSPTFSDDFDVYAHGTLIDSLDDWKATPGGALAPSVINQQARIAVRTGIPNPYIRPHCISCPLPHGMSWGLDRVYREFMRVEFDLKPVFLTTNATGDDGKISLYLAPAENSGANLDSASTPGPAVALDLACDDVGGGVVKVTPRLRAKEPAPGTTVSSVLMPTFTLPDFTGSFRTFRLDFGWDWYVNPGRHIGGDPMDPDYGKDQRGKPFLFARFMYHDGTTWRNPMVDQSTPTNPRQNPNDPQQDDRNFDGTNGWIKFGEDPGYGLELLDDSLIVKKGCDRRDWETASADPDCPRLYPYVLAERIGTADVNWFIDDFTAYPHVPEPVTLFVNTVGYDTAAPQWAMIRPNRTQWRDLPSMTAIKTQITAAELRDSSGTPLRSLAAGNLTIAGPDHCFREFDDWETWPFVNSKPIHWLRLDWTPITDEHTDCYLHVVGTTPDAQSFTVESHDFDIGEEIWWDAVWPVLLVANELARRGDLWGYTAGGWSDAGNNNAEGHAHGRFLSGIAHVLRSRRAELSTQELRDVISALIFGADWIETLVDENTDPNASQRRLDHLQFQLCDEAKADHFLRGVDPVPVAGHIWEEDNTRPRGQPNQVDDDTNDASNSIERMLACAYGLIDAAEALQPFDALTADGYAAQANASREYFYWLDGEHCDEHDMDYWLQFRSQAALDFLFDAYSPTLMPDCDDNGTPDCTNDPKAPAASTNFELARHKIEKDLDQNPFDAMSGDYTPWVGCNHGLTAPQAPPWLGFTHLLNAEPAGGYNGITWYDYLSILADRFYVGDVHPSDAANTLHISRFWKALIDHQAFKGTVQRPNEKVNYETHSIARLAMALGPTDASFETLRKLAVGSLHWVMGIHYGVRGRYMLPPSDREWECTSFVTNLGSASVVQNRRAEHYWEEPSVVAGCGGELDQPDGAGTKGPELPPWSYSPQVYGNTETFIRRDGSLLMAAECTSRLFHPSRVYEAEDAFAISGNATIESNNPDSTHLNGGQSYVGFDSGDWIKLAVDPASGTGAPDPDPAVVEKEYWILVRAANPSVGAKTVDVEFLNAGQATPFFTGSVTVPPTGHAHEYVVLMVLPTVSPPPTVKLNNGNAYEIKVVFPNGDVNVDCVVLKSRGV